MSDTPAPQPDPAVLDRLRTICLAFPEAHETSSFDHPCWRVRKKTFACYEAYGGAYVVNFKTDLFTQDRLVTGSDAYFVAPYVGRHGWTCLKQQAIDWDVLTPMLADSYRMNAPKTLVRKLDAGKGS